MLKYAREQCEEEIQLTHEHEFELHGSISMGIFFNKDTVDQRVYPWVSHLQVQPTTD